MCVFPSSVCREGPEAVSTPSTQVLASKDHSPLKGTRAPRGRADSLAGAGRNTQEPGACHCPRKKVKKSSSDGGDVSRGPKSQRKGTLTVQT